jgi:hypothetical protein
MAEVMTDGDGPAGEGESRDSITEWLNLLNGAGWQAHGSPVRDLKLKDLKILNK